MLGELGAHDGPRVLVVAPRRRDKRADTSKRTRQQQADRPRRRPFGAGQLIVGLGDAPGARQHGRRQRPEEDPGDTGVTGLFDDVAARVEGQPRLGGEPLRQRQHVPVAGCRRHAGAALRRLQHLDLVANDQRADRPPHRHHGLQLAAQRSGRDGIEEPDHLAVVAVELGDKRPRHGRRAGGLGMAGLGKLDGAGEEDGELLTSTLVA